MGCVKALSILPTRSDSNSVGRRKYIVDDVSGIARCSRFKNQYFRFLPGTCSVFGAPWDEAEFSGPQLYPSVTKFDAYFPPPDQEQLVFVFVMMPGKYATEFYEFQFLSVQLSDDLGPPMIINLGELVSERCFVHVNCLGSRNAVAQYVRGSRFGNSLVIVLKLPGLRNIFAVAAMRRSTHCHRHNNIVSRFEGQIAATVQIKLAGFFATQAEREQAIGRQEPNRADRASSCFAL